MSKYREPAGGLEPLTCQLKKDILIFLKHILESIELIFAPSVIHLFTSR